jgi:hypothetical protein
MENKSILDNEVDHGLNLNSFSKDRLQKAAAWAKFLAIMLFVNSVYSIYNFAKMVMATNHSYTNNSFDLSEMLIGIISISMIIFTFFAAFNLLNFSNSIKKALERKNNKLLTMSMESLKSYFFFYGLYMIVIALMIALMIYLIFFAYNQVMRF